MSHYDIQTGTQSADQLSQEQQNLMNVVSNVAAQAARAAVESTSLGLAQSTQQGTYSGQTLPLAQAQQAQRAQAQQAQQAQAQRQAGQRGQSVQHGTPTSPSFSQQTTSPQLSAFQQQASQAQAQQQYSPAVDVIEGNEEVHIFADLPGVDSDSIEIQASNNTLSLSAERIESQQDDQQGDPVMAERGKVMQRQVQLPAKCNVDDASATWNKGVVTITLPKVEAESTKRIGVE